MFPIVPTSAAARASVRERPVAEARHLLPVGRDDGVHLLARHLPLPLARFPFAEETLGDFRLFHESLPFLLLLQDAERAQLDRLVQALAIGVQAQELEHAAE